jgi:hypothetical protein
LLLWATAGCQEEKQPRVVGPEDTRLKPVGVSGGGPAKPKQEQGKDKEKDKSQDNEKDEAKP